IDIFELEPERRLVTSIEVLSPSNKKKGSEGWNQYLRKRQALLLGKANLVEIDLLRGGSRLPMLDPRPESPYSLLVARKEMARAARSARVPPPGRCRRFPSRWRSPTPTSRPPCRRWSRRSPSPAATGRTSTTPSRSTRP